jgi:hypothetical protein
MKKGTENSISAEKFRKAIQGAQPKPAQSPWEQQAFSGYAIQATPSSTSQPATHPRGKKRS